MQWMWTIVAIVALGLGVATWGCGDDDDDDDDGTGDTDADTDTDTDADADWGTCMRSCSGPADCVPTDADETKDEDNWSCETDHCVYLGCQDTAECQAIFPSMANIACNTAVEPHNCTLPCDAAADCEVPDSVLYGADNWSCESQLCVYSGCNSDEECAEAYPEEDVGCAQYADPSVCFPSCEAPVDCTDAAVTAVLFDEEHWLCTDGVCEHHGCKSTQECEDSAVYGAGFICVF
jgi:hypothetical protein